LPASDLSIEHLADLRAAFIARARHPLAARKKLALSDLLAFPIASTPLSDEVARRLVSIYGVQADPARMVTLRCEEISSLLDTVRETNAIFLGITAAAQRELHSGRFVELPVHPIMPAKARFALITLAGRTPGPALAFLRGFIAQRFSESALH
jgi:DNA-binding transcriptional LysR family regulator